MSTTIIEPIVTWEKLPADFPLPDEPVDNISQPAIAVYLSVFECDRNYCKVTGIEHYSRIQVFEPHLL